MSESRESGESRFSNCSNRENPTKYNDIESIDMLIERLETNPIRTASSSPAITKAIEKRQLMIAELNQLRIEAEMLREQEKVREQEQRELEEIERENKELESTIQNVRKLVKKPMPTPLKEQPRGNASIYYDDGESRDSSESRW